MYIVAAKKIKDRRKGGGDREKEKRGEAEKEREHSTLCVCVSLSLFLRTLIVNMEDRRHNRNSNYGEKCKGKERENAIDFPQASEQEKSC